MYMWGCKKFHDLYDKLCSNPEETTPVKAPVFIVNSFSIVIDLVFFIGLLGRN